MGFRIRKSISLGKGLRLNLGKSGVTSVTMGKRGAPHVTVGKGGTRFGTPVIPGTGISYETRLDKPSKKTRRKNTTMNRQQGPAPMPAGRATPMPQQAAMPTQQMPIIPPAGAMPPYAPATPPYGGGNGGNPHKAKKPWYKRWWGLTIIVLLAIGVISYIFTPSKPIPNTVGQTVSEARTTLEKDGFKTVTVTPETKGKDKKWKVEKQTPEAGQKEKTSTTITLTVKRDNSDLPDIAKKGMMLDKAINALTSEGYAGSEYKIESDSGESVILYSNWEILSANNGVIRVHNKAADEEAARKAEEEKKKAEEEAAQKAEEEKKAAEEQARQQAEQQAQQQAAAEEAARQAQQQAEQQQAQQQTAPPSIGTVRGGSFCSSEGSTGTSSAGNILTCRVASDGRLRWMK
ncbi:DUF4236 domain-containing protein [Bifidobacterium longum]|uniref:DUF4236 domain-containing protein n=1 Tax=Bifidobacterium longum TaxID=216816 RepID=UPI0009879CC6|nr:DUF4236 domain-containing protein [Bifidobacterium longum]